MRGRLIIAMMGALRGSAYLFLVVSPWCIADQGDHLFSAASNQGTMAASLSPKDVVNYYCQADLDGAKLSTENYKKSGLDSLIIQSGRPAPGYDERTLVSAFSIKSVRMAPGAADRADVTVEYSVAATWMGISDLTEEHRTERYTFHVRQRDGKWRIEEPLDLMPHISVRTAVKNMEMLLQTQGELPEGAYGQQVLADEQYVLKRLQVLLTKTSP